MISPAPTPASGRGLGLSSVCATVVAIVPGAVTPVGGRAFEVLVDQSRPRNIRVTVLAEEVVEVVGTLPRR